MESQFEEFEHFEKDDRNEKGIRENPKKRYNIKEK
jgi:hypothetical protein